MAVELRFQAMGTRGHLLVIDGPIHLAEQLERRAHELEDRWSRFVPTSEISRLNRAGGRPTSVSAETVRLLTCAIDGWDASYGLFDPTVLGDVEAAGYDRTFSDIETGPAPSSAPPSTARAPALASAVSAWERSGRVDELCGDIEVDAANGVVRLPVGVGFDPGGIGKGLAADVLVEQAIEAGATGVLVDLGGDVRVAGSPPGSARCWTIEIEDPFAASHDGPGIGMVDLTEGAVATSSRRRRRWMVDGEERHHLIDPRLGRPVESDVASVTVVAAHGWQAEVLAKAAFVGGPVQGLGLVEQLGGAGLVIDIDGHAEASPGWHRFGPVVAAGAGAAR